MSISEKIKNNKYLISALAFTILNMVAIFWFFGFQSYDDSNGYIDIIHLFQGKEVAMNPGLSWELMAPLGSFIALPFEFLGDGAGIIVENALFYFFSAYLIFKIIQLIFHNEKQAFWGSILFAGSLPMLKFGLSYMTDMGAWFFYILSIFLTLLYLKNRNEKLIIINGLLSGIGTLMKTDGGLGIMFFLMMILLSKEFNLKKKFFKALKFGIPFLLPVAIFQIYLFSSFGFTTFSQYSSYNQWFFSQQGLEELRAYPGSVYSDLNRFTIIIYIYAGEFLKAFGILGLFFSLIGLWREWLQKSKERIKIYLALLPASLSFLIFPPTDSRLAFISTPLLILWATQGLIYLKGLFSENKGKIVIPILMTGYVVFNYYFSIVGSYRLIILKLISFIK